MFTDYQPEGPDHTDENSNTIQHKVRKPRTRSAASELEQKAQSALPPPEYLLKASPADIAQLKVYAGQQECGGPDLTELRGYSRQTKSSSQSISKRRRCTKRQRCTDYSSTTGKSRKSTTPYHPGFMQHLIDHCVYWDKKAPKPNNWEEIKKRLSNSRSTLPLSDFSEATFEAFQASDLRAKDEYDVMIDVVPVISGGHQERHFLARRKKFGNLYPLTDGTIVPAKPDFFYGARLEQLDRQIRDELSHYIIPSTMEDEPMAPNFYLEAKGPDVSIAVARRQACYHGAMGARGVQKLQSYKKNGLVYDKNTYTITSIYHNGQLQMYTTHITPSSGSGKLPEYHTNQLGAWCLIGSRDQFQQGVTAFRNGGDLAKEWRDQFISAANERVGPLNAEPSTAEASNSNGPSDNIVL